MKNIKYCIVILGMILAVGCGDFLDEYSQDEIIPSTADDLDQLLVGEAYPIVLPILSYLDLLTDDVIIILQFAQYQCLVTGQCFYGLKICERLEIRPINTWEYYYARIMGVMLCWIISMAIGDVSKRVM
ncbi:MAG: hypothetical protein ACLU4N_11645 [Butyricimonas faecihominis]